MKLEASDLLELLSKKHAEDVFVSECKSGSTIIGSHRRLDAWVLKRTWSPVTMIGYEVKVSRSDFVGDEKWPAYLELCHQLSFVCPYGLIQPEELPDNVGLIWTSKNGTRLYTKRKAPHRQIDPPWRLLTYVLMSRSKIVSGWHEANGTAYSGLAYWKDWLAQRQEEQKVGRAVRTHLHRETRAVHRENERLRARIESYDRIVAEVRALGIDPDSAWRPEDRVREALVEREAAIPRGLPKRISQMADQLTRLAGELDELRNGKQGELGL